MNERIIVNGVNREMTDEEQALALANRPNPRIGEIEIRKQEIQARFKEIDIQRNHHVDLIITDDEWEVFRLEKIALYNEWHELKQELTDLNA